MDFGDKQYVIYDKVCSVILSFDCGSKENETFPDQKKLKNRKPFHSEVIEMA
jgi:hypothetical protein